MDISIENVKKYQPIDQLQGAIILVLYEVKLLFNCYKYFHCISYNYIHKIR